MKPLDLKLAPRPAPAGLGRGEAPPAKPVRGAAPEADQGLHGEALSKAGWDTSPPAPPASGAGGAPPPAGTAVTGRGSDERAFLPAALEIEESPAHPLARAIALSLCAFLVIAVAWSWIGRIDIVAVAQGKLAPAGQVKIIQPLETGVVRAIHVANGQAVRAGDPLLELDPTESDADRQRLTDDLALARVRIARIEALLANLRTPEKVFLAPAGVPPQLINMQVRLMQAQAADYSGRLAELKKTRDAREAEYFATAEVVDSLENTLPLLDERVGAYKILSEKRYVARTTYLALAQEQSEMAGNLAAGRFQLQQAVAALDAVDEDLRQTRDEIRHNLLTELADVERQATIAQQELRKAEQRARLQLLAAPVDGMVQELAAHTIGGVVTTAEPVMVIVPREGRLMVEANVLNKDIGFVEAGQPVEVKLDTFPFTRYGTIDGRVEHISRDAVEDPDLGLVYRAQVAMDRAQMEVDGRTVNLTAGMSAAVEIKTGDRPLVEFLLAPLFRYRDEGLRER